jgi:hypothetical protein
VNRRRVSLRTLFLVGLIVIATADESRASSIVVSAGTINFSVQSRAPGGAAAVFDPAGKLVCPGNGFDCLGPVVPPVETFAGVLEPTLVGIAHPALIDTGAFGDAAAEFSALPVPGGLALQFFVHDFALNAPVPLTSVMDAAGTVTVTNTGPPVTGFGGGLFGIHGFLGAGGYLAGSLTGTVGGLPFTPIIVAADGVGGLPDFASAGTYSFFTPFPDTSFEFFAGGISLIEDAPGVFHQFSLNTGDVLTLTATYTCATDLAFCNVQESSGAPPKKIFNDGIIWQPPNNPPGRGGGGPPPGGFPPPPGGGLPLPPPGDVLYADLNFFAFSPAPVVPEPGIAVLVTAGLLGALRYRARRRNRT